MPNARLEEIRRTASIAGQETGIICHDRVNLPRWKPRPHRFFGAARECEIGHACAAVAVAPKLLDGALRAKKLSDSAC